MSTSAACKDASADESNLVLKTDGRADERGSSFEHIAGTAGTAGIAGMLGSPPSGRH